MKKNTATALALLMLVAVAHHLSSSRCRTPLYNNLLLERDRDTIVEYFRQNKIPYAWGQDDRSILVKDEPEARLLRKRLFFQGIPTGVAAVNPAPPIALGRTAAEEKAINQQLLEGELTNFLRSLPDIEDAKLKIAVIDKCCYGPPHPPSNTARVFILHSAPIDPSTWPQFGHYLQMMVPHPEIRGLTVIDSKGVVLYESDF